MNEDFVKLTQLRLYFLERNAYMHEQLCRAVHQRTSQPKLYEAGDVADQSKSLDGTVVNLLLVPNLAQRT